MDIRVYILNEKVLDFVPAKEVTDLIKDRIKELVAIGFEQQWPCEEVDESKGFKTISSSYRATGHATINIVLYPCKDKSNQPSVCVGCHELSVPDGNSKMSSQA